MLSITVVVVVADATVVLNSPGSTVTIETCVVLFKEVVSF